MKAKINKKEKAEQYVLLHYGITGNLVGTLGMVYDYKLQDERGKIYIVLAASQ